MTGKEALETLNKWRKCTLPFDEHSKAIEVIGKDLEILDKIKSFVKEWWDNEFPAKSGDYYMGEILEVLCNEIHK